MAEDVTISEELYTELQNDSLLLAILERHGLKNTTIWLSAKSEWYDEMSKEAALTAS